MGAAAALRREESRGAHFRADYPKTGNIAERTLLTLSEAEQIACEAEIPSATRIASHA
ncbi:MAG: hypothetical protein V3S07_04275 [Micropepsaceae bacterium]